MDAPIDFLWNFLNYTWPFWAFVVLLPIAAETWTAYRQKRFEHNLKWVLLEIVIPREIKTSPKAMEQVFAQIYALVNYPGNIKERWWIGEVTLWHSFEIAAFDGQIHFYVRSPKQYKNLVEAAFFAYYPDIEIVEVEDYMARFPASVAKLYQNGYRMWGREVLLERSGLYPIKSYVHFESPDEDKQYDPMSGFIELLSKLKPDEFAVIQILCWPALTRDPHYAHALHEYEAEFKKLLNKKPEGEEQAHKAKLKFHGILPNIEAPEEKKEERPRFTMRTPAENEILTELEENLARPMFNTVIRYAYAAPFSTYSEDFSRRSMMGAFNQYGARDMNSFKSNQLTQTRGNIWEPPYIFPQIRKEHRRQLLWYNLRHREIPPHTWMGRLLTSHTFVWNFGSEAVHLNTRSLATLWHPPTYAILTGPHMHRIESKKAGPPAGLEIFGEEEHISKFQ